MNPIKLHKHLILLTWKTIDKHVSPYIIHRFGEAYVSDDTNEFPRTLDNKDIPAKKEWQKS